MPARARGVETEGENGRARPFPCTGAGPRASPPPPRRLTSALPLPPSRYCAEIAASASAKTRKDIILRAQVLAVRLTNGNARVQKTE